MSSKIKDFFDARSLCIGLLIYVFSVGPAVRLCVGKVCWVYPNGITGIVWRPIMWLDRTAAYPVFRAYMSLWGVRVYEPVRLPY